MILIFVILTLLITWPVIFNINNYIYGYPDDTLATLASLWYHKFAILHKLDPALKPYIAFPFGEGHAPYSYPIFDQITGILTLLTNEIVTWNVLSISNFILSAFFMYLLVRYLAKNGIAAFISGIIYGFCPHICMQSFNHIHMAAIQWMPLYILFLLKFIFERNYRNADLCGIFYALVIFFNPYYGYYMLLFTMIFVVFLLLKHIKNLGQVIKKGKFKILKLVGIAFFSALIIITSFEYRVIKAIFLKNKSKETQAVYTRPLEGLIFSGARPKDFLLPPRTNPVLKNISKPFMSPDFGSMIDHTLYLGYIPLILSIIAVGFWRRKKMPTKPTAARRLSSAAFSMIGAPTLNQNR